MSSQAWPFVVARNHLLDWRPIIAPTFMVADRSSFLLTHETVPNDDSDPSRPTLRIVGTSRSGMLTLIYRFIAPAPRDGTRLLRDNAGRPIFLVEGFVVQGDVPEALTDWGPELSSIDGMARRAFEQFWDTEDESYTATASAPFVPQRPAVPAPGHGRKRTWRTAASAAFMVAVVTFVFVWWLHGAGR